MSLDQPQKNKMMTSPPSKKSWHFSGDGVFHNMTVEAENIEAATKEWLAKRIQINTPTDMQAALDIEAPQQTLSEQSTPAAEPCPENEVQ